ncbi:hypothetical protein Tco_1092749 [Tanacetum coccineum]|uniref:DUF4283 domain-containing protein n=1 Tax=Tanacetum coccineum TaxID=301880 RepID=A0ABQ5IAR3_9ASTR
MGVDPMVSEENVEKGDGNGDSSGCVKNVGEIGSKVDDIENATPNTATNEERMDNEFGIETEEVTTNPKLYEFSNGNKGDIVDNMANKEDEHCHGNIIKEVNNSMSYAKKVFDNLQLDDNELFYVPTTLNNNGDEVVLCEEELVKEGSEKWKYTVCGYFMGCKMGVNELRYNVRRMWGRFGLKDIVVDADRMCYFKFK